MSATGEPLVGILAIQGDVDAHAEALQRVGARTVRVRRGKDLDATSIYLCIDSGHSAGHIGHIGHGRRQLAPV